MKRNTMLFAIAAAAFCAVGAHAQTPNQPQAAPAAAPAAAPKMTPEQEQKKAAWQAGVKADCSVEIAAGGVCAGKDFSTGLEACLHKNHKALSAGCKVAVHPYRGSKDKKAPPAGTP